MSKVAATNVLPYSRAHAIKALVGGTLIDGCGGRPVRNSVILIDGERISAVGVQGSLAVPGLASTRYK